MQNREIIAVRLREALNEIAEAKGELLFSRTEQAEKLIIAAELKIKEAAALLEEAQ